jgi:putative CRISPR-associated protein (TIGR02619 family)
VKPDGKEKPYKITKGAAVEIKFTPLGGGREIGANAYLVEWGERRLLLDAGMHPSRIGVEALVPVEKLPPRIDAVILTHAHFDHIASLPHLFGKCEIGEVFLPRQSVAIGIRMLRNTAATIRHNYPDVWWHVEFEAYRRRRLDPLFRRLTRSGYDYGEDFVPAAGLRGSFFDAGHVLGSAGVLLTDGDYTLVYTGDIHTAPHGIHRPARLPELARVDCLVLEATAARDTGRAPETAVREEFYGYLMAAALRRGRVLIPAFALGRTQDILALIARGKEEERLPDVPVYLTGLGNAITEIYDQVEQARSSLRRLFFRLGSSLKDVFTPLESEELESVYHRHRERRETAVFIATNGMMEPSTPSARLGKLMVGDAAEAILFPGFQAPGTLGRDVLEAAAGSRLDFRDGGPPAEVRTQHRKMVRFSSHTDQRGLLKIVRTLNPDQVVVVHGAPDSIEVLTGKLVIAGRRVVAPGVGETVLLRGKPQVAQGASLGDFPAVIVTVGTSLRNWFTSREYPFGEDPRADAERLLQAQPRDGRYPSAEIQTLELLEFSGQEYFYFLTSDDAVDEVGYRCGAALAHYYNRRGFHAEVYSIPGLAGEVRRFQEEGLPNLVNRIMDLIQAHDGNARIIATGGYKAETALATLVGMLRRVPVYYVYEDMPSVIRFSNLPIRPDFRLLERQVQNIGAILRQGDAAKAENMIRHNLPPGMDYLFQDRSDGKGKELSPTGRLFMNFYRQFRRVTPQRTITHLKCGKYAQNLWTTGPVPIHRLPHQDLRLIIKRIRLQENYLHELRLREPDPAHTAPESHLVYLETRRHVLHYRLICPDGSQRLEIHCHPGAETVVLENLGRKIYA